MEKVSEAGLTMISGGNTAPSLTFFAGERGESQYAGYYRTSDNDQNTGAAAAHFAFEELGIQKIASIHDGDPFTEGQATVFDVTFKELGGEVVFASSVNKDDQDMQPILQSVAGSGAELLFLSLFRPAGDFIVDQAKDVEGL